MADDQSVITPDIPCNLCGGSDIKVVGNMDRDGSPLRSVICLDCGLVWIDPRPGSGDLKKFYAEKYRLQYKSAARPKLKHVHRETQRALQRYERIKTFLDQGVKILDTGSGAGFFPYLLKQHGYEVKGIEPNHGYAGYATEELEVDVNIGFIQDIEYNEGSFDVITLNHVLEHLEDPCAVLKRLFCWNRPGGYLNVEVPNIEATYHAPGHKFHLAHLYTFNPDNLIMMGRKAGYLKHDMKLMAGTRHINIIFQKPAEQESEPVLPDFRIQGNYMRIQRILDNHTSLRHYLSGNVYMRFFRKNLGYLKEKIAVRRFSSGREIVDYLIARDGT